MKRPWQAQPAADEVPPHDGAFLQCRGIDAGYDKVQILFGVDLEVQRGEIVALPSTNGAGKSTLLKANSCRLPPSAGSIQPAGQCVARAGPGASAPSGPRQGAGRAAVDYPRGDGSLPNCLQRHVHAPIPLELVGEMAKAVGNSALFVEGWKCERHLAEFALLDSRDSCAACSCAKLLLHVL